MRLLQRVFWVGVIVLATIFAFINLHDVSVNLDPLGLGFDVLQSAQIPLAFVILGSVAVGLIVGVMLMWLSTWPSQRALSSERREARKLRRENERMSEALKQADHPDTAGPPVVR